MPIVPLFVIAATAGCQQGFGRCVNWPDEAGATMSSLNVSRMKLRHDCEIAIRRGGSGPTLLMLHGADGAANLLEVATALSASCHVIVPEHPGFDSSDDPDWVEAVDDLAYFYLDLIDSIGRGPVHLFGHSLGGWIAAEIGVRNPGCLKSLTLVSSAGIRIRSVPPGDNYLWSRQEAVEHLYASAVLREGVLSKEFTIDEQLAQMKNRRSAAKLSWSPRWYNPRLSRWLDRIHVPTKVIWGDSDGLFPPAYATEFGKLLPNAHVTVLPNCGHLPHLEHPSRVKGLVLDAVGSAS